MDTGSLKIDLFDRGMGPLHRAGLGGLACNLKRLDWPEDEWRIDPDHRSVTLFWPGGPAGARDFFKRLYERAFGLDNGMIDLPGAYGHSPPGPEIKAQFQRGMSLTILQFGPNRKARGKALKAVEYQVDDMSMVVEHQDLVSYTHRDAWKELVAPNGPLREMVKVPGTIAPGFSQRHAALGPTIVEQPPGHAVALHFALVGTLSLAIGNARSVLIVPEVTNLEDFIWGRPSLNPKVPRDCQIVSPADGALQAMVRLRAVRAGRGADVPRCWAVLFSSTVWNPNQKSRSAVLEIDPDREELGLFESAMRIEELKPRLVQARPEKKGDAPRSFWAGGIVRGLIAENLARHRKWFANFRSLVVGPDGRDDKKRVGLLNFEKEGLRKMIDQPWEDKGEEVLVKAIHEAMKQCFGRIWDESRKDATTFGNRYERQMERWRLALAHAKTADDVRGGLSDIWGRAGQVRLLQESWRELLPVLCDDRRWMLNRDLALLALASYKKSDRAKNDAEGPGDDESAPASAG